MATNPSYSVEEMRVLRDAPVHVGAAVAAAAPSGIFGTIKEGLAIVNSILNAANRHPNNQLIQEVIPKQISQEQIDSWVNAARSLLQQSEAERVINSGLETCRITANTLQMKSSPQEAEDFKLWLMEIGQQVASSAKEGGVAISSGEASVLYQMASILGISRQP